MTLSYGKLCRTREPYHTGILLYIIIFGHHNFKEYYDVVYSIIIRLHTVAAHTRVPLPHCGSAVRLLVRAHAVPRSTVLNDCLYVLSASTSSCNRGARHLAICSAPARVRAG